MKRHTPLPMGLQKIALASALHADRIRSYNLKWKVFEAIFQGFFKGSVFGCFSPEFQGKNLWLQSTIQRKIAKMMVEIIRISMHEKMKMATSR